jgi:hypothetical protein
MTARSIVLSERVEAWRHRPFRYGESDCCQFVADVVLAISGIDYRARFPRYASESEAYEVLAAHSGAQGLIESVLGPAMAPSFARRGDVVLADFGDGLAAGICLGVQCCAPGARGLTFRPMTFAVAAWSI